MWTTDKVVQEYLKGNSAFYDFATQTEYKPIGGYSEKSNNFSFYVNFTKELKLPEDFPKFIRLARIVQYFFPSDLTTLIYLTKDFVKDRQFMKKLKLQDFDTYVRFYLNNYILGEFFEKTNDIFDNDKSDIKKVHKSIIDHKYIDTECIKESNLLNMPYEQNDSSFDVSSFYFYKLASHIYLHKVAQEDNTREIELLLYESIMLYFKNMRTFYPLESILEEAFDKGIISDALYQELQDADKKVEQVKWYVHSSFYTTIAIGIHTLLKRKRKSPMMSELIGLFLLAFTVIKRKIGLYAHMMLEKFTNLVLLEGKVERDGTIINSEPVSFINKYAVHPAPVILAHLSSFWYVPNGYKKKVSEIFPLVQSMFCFDYPQHLAALALYYKDRMSTEVEKQFVTAMKKLYLNLNVADENKEELVKYVNYLEGNEEVISYFEGKKFFDICEYRDGEHNMYSISLFNELSALFFGQIDFCTKRIISFIELQDYLGKDYVRSYIGMKEEEVLKVLKEKCDNLDEEKLFFDNGVIKRLDLPLQYLRK